MDINEIRKYFYESNDYVIRIRKNKDGEVADIVYYRGIKIFTITKTQLALSEKIFNINDKIYKKSKKNKKATAKALINIREKIKGFLKVKGTANIAFKESDSEAYSKEDKENAIKEIEGKIRNNKELSKYFEFVKDKDKYTLKLTQNCEPEEPAEIECDVLECFVSDYAHRGWKKPAFNLFEAKIKLNKLYINNGRLVLGKNGDIDITDKAVQEAVKTYEKYAYEAEKNYQHLFMTDEKIKYKADEFKDILRFEEEYYIADRTDSGRIDNIFIKYNGDKTADLYLIELKYGNKVLDGDHGIIDHLEDIKDLMSDKAKLSRSDFMDKLIARINYRTEQINEISNKKYDEINSFRNVYFWIVIGYSNDKADIENTLNGLNDGIKSRVENLSEYNCNVKILLDKTEFSQADKISLTKEKFEPWTYD